MRERRDYHVFLICPHCCRSKWVLLRGRQMSLEEVLNSLWVFDCPVHGQLCGRPLQASPRRNFQRNQ